MGVWWHSPQPLDAGCIGGLGAEPPALGDFNNFLIKITCFYAYLGLNFSFKTYGNDNIHNE